MHIHLGGVRDVDTKADDGVRGEVIDRKPKNNKSNENDKNLFPKYINLQGSFLLHVELHKKMYSASDKSVNECFSTHEQGR